MLLISVCSVVVGVTVVVRGDMAGFSKISHVVNLVIVGRMLLELDDLLHSINIFLVEPLSCSIVEGRTFLVSSGCLLSISCMDVFVRQRVASSDMKMVVEFVASAIIAAIL